MYPAKETNHISSEKMTTHFLSTANGKLGPGSLNAGGGIRTHEPLKDEVSQSNQ
ncbi:MAG: hypothetical protein M3297_05605 [Thermoproteota archaeon]|nr:hypothetical protein [Thermoproteota archaeon]